MLHSVFRRVECRVVVVDKVCQIHCQQVCFHLEVEFAGNLEDDQEFLGGEARVEGGGESEGGLLEQFLGDVEALVNFFGSEVFHL